MNGQRGNGLRPVMLLCVLIMLAMLYLGYCLGVAGKPTGPEWLEAIGDRFQWTSLHFASK